MRTFRRLLLATFVAVVFQSVAYLLLGYVSYFVIALSVIAGASWVFGFDPWRHSMTRGAREYEEMIVSEGQDASSTVDSRKRS